MMYRPLRKRTFTQPCADVPTQRQRGVEDVAEDRYPAGEEHFAEADGDGAEDQEGASPPPGRTAIGDHGGSL